MLKEHLFRDDAGAAVEKAARLEEENAELRKEIEALKSLCEHGHGGGHDHDREAITVRTQLSSSSRSNFAGYLLGIAVGGILMMGMAGMFLILKPSSPREPRYVRAPLPYEPLTTASIENDLPPPAPPTAVIISAPNPAATENCTDSFWFDQDGVKHYKQNCLSPPPHL